MHKLIRVPVHLIRRLIGKPKTVRILAAGPATRHFCPWDEEAEIWSLNRFWRAVDEKTGEPWVKRWDRWFEIHQPSVHLAENDGTTKPHIDWLLAEHDFPIYFLQEADKYPSGVQYPLADIIPEFRGCLTSSIGYMVALAIHEGFDRIELYGVEMVQGSEYYWQKSGLLRLLGRAEGEFIDVYTPPNSSLLRDVMYGMDDKEAHYDNWLRIKLHEVKKAGFLINKHLHTASGVAQGIGFVMNNIVSLHPELLETKLPTTITALLRHWRGEARQLEGSANVASGMRQQIVEELSYREVEVEDNIDVAGGGTSLGADIKVTHIKSIDDALKFVETDWELFKQDWEDDMEVEDGERETTA